MDIAHWYTCTSSCFLGMNWKSFIMHCIPWLNCTPHTFPSKQNMGVLHGKGTVLPQYSVLGDIATVKLVLRGHWHERPPVLKDHTHIPGWRFCLCNWTCQQRPPVWRPHIVMADGTVFIDSFYCISVRVICFTQVWNKIKIWHAGLGGWLVYSIMYHQWHLCHLCQNLLIGNI